MTVAEAPVVRKPDDILGELDTALCDAAAELGETGVDIVFGWLAGTLEACIGDAEMARTKESAHRKENQMAFKLSEQTATLHPVVGHVGKLRQAVDTASTALQLNDDNQDVNALLSALAALEPLLDKVSESFGGVPDDDGDETPAPMQAKAQESGRAARPIPAPTGMPDPPGPYRPALREARQPARLIKAPSGISY